jgi:hypothetical protein
VKEDFAKLDQYFETVSNVDLESKTFTCKLCRTNRGTLFKCSEIKNMFIHLSTFHTIIWNSHDKSNFTENLQNGRDFEELIQNNIKKIRCCNCAWNQTSEKNIFAMLSHWIDSHKNDKQRTYIIFQKVNLDIYFICGNGTSCKLIYTNHRTAEAHYKKIHLNIHPKKMVSHQKFFFNFFKKDRNFK